MASGSQQGTSAGSQQGTSAGKGKSGRGGSSRPATKNSNPVGTNQQTPSRTVADFLAVPLPVEEKVYDVEAEDAIEKSMRENLELKLATLVVSNITPMDMRALKALWPVPFRLIITPKGDDFCWVEGGKVDEMLRLKAALEMSTDHVKSDFSVDWITMRLSGPAAKNDRTRQVTGNLRGHADKFGQLKKEVEKLGVTIVDSYLHDEKGFFNLYLAKREMAELVKGQQFAIGGHAISLSKPPNVIPVEHPLEVIVANGIDPRNYSRIKQYVFSAVGYSPLGLRKPIEEDVKLVFHLATFEETQVMLARWCLEDVEKPELLSHWNTRVNTYRAAQKSGTQGVDIESRMKRLEDAQKNMELARELDRQQIAQLSRDVQLGQLALQEQTEKRMRLIEQRSSYTASLLTLQLQRIVAGLRTWM